MFRYILLISDEILLVVKNVKLYSATLKRNDLLKQHLNLDYKLVE